MELMLAGMDSLAPVVLDYAVGSLCMHLCSWNSVLQMYSLIYNTDCLKILEFDINSTSI